MAVQNVIELDRQWATVGNRADCFRRLYPYILLLRGCHIGNDYVPSEALANAFELTPEGVTQLEILEKIVPDIDFNSRRLGVATYFSHDELFVDVEKTKISDLHAALQAEIDAERIRFPQVYGRLLYDRFFEAFPSRISDLSFEETDALFEGLPNACYQVGRLTIGPLGLAESASWRNFAPNHNAPLWHCSDPGCTALHNVRLGIAYANVNRATAAIAHRFSEIGALASEWDELFLILCDSERGYYRDFSMHRLPYLLADGFSKEELRAVLLAAFQLDKVSVRRHLETAIDINRSADEIADSLTEHELFQSLLMLNENLLGRAVEAAVLRGTIKVPVTEARRPMVSPTLSHSWWGLTPEVGSLGLRTVSTRGDFALVRLQKLLRHIGAGAAGPAALVEWELRFAPGNTVSDKLARAIQSQTPRSLLRRFVLASAESMRTSVEYLQPMFFDPPTTEDEENELIDRITWKLGFDVVQHPSELSTFWKRAAGMRAAIDTRSDRLTSTEEDALRGAAVNYFVSLEDIFDRTLSFTGWALLHDHYAPTATKRFRFNLEDARKLVAETLNRAGSSETLNPDGRNTLWPLVVNLRFLADHLKTTADRAPEDDLRPPSSLPEFHRAGAAPFAFEHYTPIYDLQADSVAIIVALLRETSGDLARIDMSNLRNRLEHKRSESEFPTVNEVRAALDVIEDCVTKIEVAGLIPVLHIFESEIRDEYNRKRTVLREYAGRALETVGPTGSRFSRMPLPAEPQVPLKVAQLKAIPDVLRFRLSEDSTFRRKWIDYPRV